jgi:hypothetical protein
MGDAMHVGKYMIGIGKENTAIHSSNQSNLALTTRNCLNWRSKKWLAKVKFV